MSWQAILQLIAEEVGAEAAGRIEERARHEFGGMRITIGKRQVITAELVESVAPGKPQEAAKQLGVHHSTIYRAIHRQRIIR